MSNQNSLDDESELSMEGGDHYMELLKNEIRLGDDRWREKVESLPEEVREVAESIDVKDLFMADYYLPIILGSALIYNAECQSVYDLEHCIEVHGDESLSIEEMKELGHALLHPPVFELDQTYVEWAEGEGETEFIELDNGNFRMISKEMPNEVKKSLQAHNAMVQKAVEKYHECIIKSARYIPVMGW